MEVHDISPRAGGLIATPGHQLGSYETGANAMFNTALVEDLFSDLGLEICSPTAEARKKYIFRSTPQRWPLTVLESAGLFLRWIMNKLTFQTMPRPLETLEQWGHRVLGRAATQHLLSPAIQGIYAGDPKRLSATLLLSRVLRRNRLLKPKVRGSVFPREGMEQLIEALVKKIESRDGKLFLSSQIRVEENRERGPVVLAMSPKSAARVLQNLAPRTADKLNSIEMLPLAVVELYLPTNDRPVSGFGCLFPSDAGFHSLGVLFDHFLYPHRLRQSAERWILGGSRNRDIDKLSDDEIVSLAKADHVRLGGQGKIDGAVVTRWPYALPHYTIELETLLTEIELPENVFLMGNYLGSIGLSQILVQAEELAKELAEKYEA